MEDILSRCRILVGDDIDKLMGASVILFGVGGVGGYVAEILARCGVGHITLVDNDVVSVSNINRQIIATADTIGQAKVDVMAKRIATINESISVCAICKKYTPADSEKFFDREYDYCIDAIDDVPGKIGIIKYCKAHNIPVISSMGAGNRYGVPQYVVMDIFDTSYDPLARKIRHELRRAGVEECNVVCATTPAMAKATNTIGSICYHPMACGSVLAGYVINELLNVFRKK